MSLWRGLLSFTCMSSHVTSCFNMHSDAAFKLKGDVSAESAVNNTVHNHIPRPLRLLLFHTSTLQLHKSAWHKAHTRKAGVLQQ